MSRVSLIKLLERKNGRAIHLLKNKAKLEFKKKRSLRDMQNFAGSHPFDEVIAEQEDYGGEEFKGNWSKRAKMNSGSKNQHTEVKLKRRGGDFDMASQDSRMMAGSGEKPMHQKQPAFA